MLTIFVRGVYATEPRYQPPTSINPTQVTVVDVHNKLAASAGAGAYAATGPINNEANGGTGYGFGGYGGQGGNVSINNPKQWPSSFVSGYAGFSPYNCANAFGASGGYGSLLIPWESNDCKRFIAAQNELMRGNAVVYCKLMLKISVYEDAVTFDDCIAPFLQPVSTVQQSPSQWMEDFNKRFPPLPERKINTKKKIKTR